MDSDIIISPTTYPWYGKEDLRDHIISLANDLFIFEKLIPDDTVLINVIYTRNISNLSNYESLKHKKLHKSLREIILFVSMAIGDHGLCPDYVRDSTYGPVLGARDPQTMEVVNKEPTKKILLWWDEYKKTYEIEIQNAKKQALENTFIIVNRKNQKRVHKASL